MTQVMRCSSCEVEATMVRLNLFKDFEGNSERAAAVFEGDDGLFAGADRVQKRVDFCVQGLFRSNFRFGYFNFRVGRGNALLAADGKHQDVLPAVVDGNVLPRLEKAQLAHSLRRDSTGGEVGDAAGFELNARVGDVDLVRKDRQAGGANFANWRIHQ